MKHNDLSRAQWRKSSYSGNSGNCVEVAITETVVGVRDSKDRDGPVLIFTTDEWRGFIRRLRNGEFGKESA
ncbi:MAG TPA: DUF397 domain-containing protein [Streptosporangiaceae bacterium]|nr:DUF397 domain-containing protein [Streptosporangiaceae bacterium]